MGGGGAGGGGSTASRIVQQGYKQHIRNNMSSRFLWFSEKNILTLNIGLPVIKFIWREHR